MKTLADAKYLELISRLRAAREGAGVTQVQLAERMGKPQSFVTKVEHCQRRLDLLEALQFCKALRITLDDVMPESLKPLLRR